MANSFVRYTGDGSTTDFNVPFPYLDRTHVGVKVDNVTASFAWVNDTVVRLDTAPATDKRVEVRRTTPTTPLVDWLDGAVLFESELDKNTLQSLYLSEEATDNANDALGHDASDVWDAESRRIKNVSDPMAAQDAATKAYGDANWGGQAAIDAEASATAAATSETNAATSETNAATSEANAAASYDNFDDRYLGSKTGDPSLDNDGNALIEGALYWNSTDKAMKVYSGTAWGPIPNDTTKVSKAGDTMTGSLTLPGDPVNNLHAATKQYADAKLTETRIVGAKEFGLVGDGSDETTLLNQLFAAARYGHVILEEGKTYGYDPTVGLTIVGPIVITSNNSEFTETVANTTEAVTISGTGIRADSLTFNFVGAAGSEAAERGIIIDADDVDIGTLRLLAATAGTGSGSNTRNAVDIGPASGARKENVKIGLIECVNWDRPVVCQRLQNSKIGRIDCTTYVRAVYITDCLNFEILSGRVSGLSPNATGSAGENGILIDAQEASYSTGNIRISNFDVEDSGEHGFRIGGQLPIRGVWHENCSVVRSGSGVGTGVEPDDHGASGFKCLGPTSIVASNENIYYIDCTVEDVTLDGREGLNYAGFYIGKTTGGSIVNPTVRKRDNIFSSFHGFTIVGCEDFSIVNPMVSDAKDASFKFWGPPSSDMNNWGLTINFAITGGSSQLPGTVHVDAQAQDDTFRRITISDLLVEGGTHALQASVIGGAFTGCSAGFVTWSLTTALLTGAASWLVTARGQMPNTFGDAADGSTITRWNDTFHVRKAGVWTAAV